MDHITDYDTYKFSKIELAKFGLEGLLYFFVMGMIFYQHIVLALIASTGVFFYVREKRRKLIQGRKQHLREQFKEAMYTLSSSLSGGRSLEQAFTVSLKDLKIIYSEEVDIVREWALIVHRVGMNETIEVVLSDFARRADLEEIYNFVSVFVLAKKSGGDLIRIIRDTSKIINEKIEIQKEIDILVTQKKYEQKLLSYIVPGMIVFFTVSSPDFLSPMYNTLAGRLIMTLALGLYLLSAQIGKKIVEIEV